MLLDPNTQRFLLIFTGIVIGWLFGRGRPGVYKKGLGTVRVAKYPKGGYAHSLLESENGRIWYAITRE